MSLLRGTRLGPYEILGLIGAGGMGEVYRARDPRLGREVAIKVLPREVAGDPERLARFEREARAVAALNHPNILTVYDVGTHEGVPYVVMELLEGETLRELVRRRAPTQRQVLGFAVQVAQGLDAAHQKGIVHRDLKPANLFVTTQGRVKVLDFGLAKLVERGALDTEAVTESSPTGVGQVLGTVAYMSPEQARAGPVDHRSDIFSFGVVLYELLSGKHPFLRETTVGTLTAIVEETPAELSSLPRGVPPALSGIVGRCLEKDREQRFRSAHDVALSLEVVLAAPLGAASLQEVEERSPYPGLSSFTEKDAAFFFGREAEVAALWERLRSRRLSGVIGPSGAGKTSFVRAGVVASRPEGWGTLVCTPGASPLRGLGQALVPELAGDVEALQRLLSMDDPAVAFDLVSRWRKGHGEALLVVDQFEELFTLNPQEVQGRFAGLLGRLSREADVHVLLSLRDDFLMKSADHEPIAKVFESLSPLPALSAEGLRRALEEPAKKRGYRLEDEGLVGEMVGAAEGARAALPLLAFAVSRLWEKRDREKKLLTRAAYEEIGGVAGALAQHAEATLDRIGPERQGVVREIFRNLVTSHGTRAVAEREELLSAFPERKAAEDVLRELIDARLLTSYEVEGAEGEPSHHRIEIVHESLLKAWPRLVRWQTQDEEGALLRDQLKQAAHLWEEKGRTTDLLWTGTAFREYELWRERYPGALTALEDDFARSMADHALRQRRRRRAIVAAVVTAALAVATVTGVLWRRARSEALRAEAGKLLALARAELDADTTAAVAYARKSLELTDTPVARRFAIEAFWRSPAARVLPVSRIAKDLGIDATFTRVVFSPDGRWFATRGRDRSSIVLVPNDGTRARHARCSEARYDGWGFSSRGDLLLTGGPGRTLRLWSVPDLREIRTIDPGGKSAGGLLRDNTLLAFTWDNPREPRMLVRAWPIPDGEPRILGTFRAGTGTLWDASAGWIALGQGQTVRLWSLDPAHPHEERVLRLKDDVSDLAFAPRGDPLASLDRSGEIRLWSLASGPPTVLRVLQGPRNLSGSSSILLDPQATRLAKATADGALQVWELGDPPDAQPSVLRRRAAPLMGDIGRDGWLAMNRGSEIDFWPLAVPRARRLPGHTGSIAQGSLVFTSDSRWLASVGGDGVRVWPLDPMNGHVRALECGRGFAGCVSVATHPSRPEILVGSLGVELLEVNGAGRRALLDRWEEIPNIISNDLAFDREGRRVVAVPFKLAGFKDPKERVFRVWDLPSGTAHVYSVAHLTDASWLGYFRVRCAADGSILAAGQGGVFRLTLPDQPGGQVKSETLFAAPAAFFDLSADGRHLLAAGAKAAGVPADELVLFDLAQHSSRRVTTHGGRVTWAALDPAGRIIVTGDADGIVRVGPATGGEPHLLLGHSGEVVAVAVSPDGRWVASAAGDEIRLWPMPDVTKPPLHTLPHAQLLARLDTWTNLRVVADPTSPTGWKLDVGPFPGWKEVPTW